MPRYFQPHLPEIDGYCFPVVTAIIKKIGLPKPLRIIPDPFKASLTATLATEMTLVSVATLRSACQRESEVEADLERLERHGDSEYLRVRRQLSAVHTRCSALREERRKTELEAHCVSDGCSDAIPGAKFDIDPFGHRIRWRYDLLSADKIDPVRRHLKQVWQKERVLELKREHAESALRSKRAKIRALPAFEEDYKQSRWTHVQVDFSKQTLLLSNGPAFYLRNNFYSWWIAFTAAFEAQVAYDSQRAPHKLAMRDPRILRTIQERAEKNSNWDAVASSFFENDSNEWGKKKVKIGSITKMRAALRRQDRAGLAWFSPSESTFNFYVEWLRDLKEAVSRCEYWKPSELDQKWLEEILKASPRAKATGDRAWRFNELSWCLTRGWDNPYPFVPQISIRARAEDWELHRRKWWKALEAAQLKPQR